MDSITIFSDLDEIMDKKEQNSFYEIFNEINLESLEQKKTQKYSRKSSIELKEPSLIEDNNCNRYIKNNRKYNAFIQKELKNNFYLNCIGDINIIDNITENLKVLRKCKNVEEVLEALNMDIKEEETDYKTKNFDNNDNLYKKSNVSFKNKDINIKNYYFSKELYDINTTKEQTFIGKKRENSIYKNIDNEKVFLEIKQLYEKYLGKDIYYKLYEQDKSVFHKNVTVIEAGTPMCVIYFYRKKVTKIYLIIEQIFIEDKNEIFYILNEIKKNIQNYKNINLKKFIHFFKG